MIIKLSTFALVSIAMLCGNVPVSLAVGDSDNLSPQDELSVTRNHLQQAKQKIDELERQLAAGNLENAKRRIGELVIQLHAKENEIATLRSSAHENSKQLREDLASQTEELNQAKRRIAEVEQQMAAGKGQELTQAKRRATEAEQQAARKEQDLAQVKRRVAEIEQQMAGKEHELAQAKRRAAEAEQQTARREQELAQVKDDLKQVTQKLADLTPQLMARDAELARTKQLLADLERNLSQQAEGPSTQEESHPDQNSVPPQSVEENLSVTNLLPPVPAVADNAGTLLSSDLGKISQSLASLLQPELRKGNVTLRQRGNKLTLAFAIGELFTPGDATVTLGGTSLLERVGTVLHGFRYQSVEVAGHTDNQPARNDSRRGFRDNIELSRTRAEHASQALINGGLEADRVKAVGYADTKPITTNDTEKGRSKNRRMEIVITQWSELGGNSGDAKTQVGKKLRGFSTQAVTHH
jgi:flagellar motor protein MotB